MRGLFLNSTLDQHLFGISDGFSWVESLRADLCTVHDGVAAIQFEWIFDTIETLPSVVITTVNQPAIRGEQGSRTEVAITVPPVTGTAG